MKQVRNFMAVTEEQTVPYNEQRCVLSLVKSKRSRARVEEEILEADGIFG